MGIGFSAFLLAAVAGVLAGLLVRGIGKQSLVFLSVFLAVFILYVGMSFRDEGSFDKYPGAGDYWRVPLQKPYQLGMIDVLDDACLSIWDSTSSNLSCIITGITHCANTDPYFVGRTDEGLFLLNQDDGVLQAGLTQDSLRFLLEEVGLGPLPKFKTVRAYYEEHWSAH